MKKILVTGAMGQIGSELTLKIREHYGKDSLVIASDLREMNKSDLPEGLCFEQLDCTKMEDMERVIKEYEVDTVYHMAAILSAVGEAKPKLAYNVNMNGLYNILEVAVKYKCSVFVPSSIAAFGKGTPLDNTPQDTIQRPDTMYGVTKVAGELLCDYYHKRFGLDVRGVRYPGIISYKTLPGGGTTDYAVEIYYEAVKNGCYNNCFLSPDTRLDMMYMPDALNATINLMDADGKNLIHRNAFNVTSFSITPQDLAESIKKIIPEFKIEYKVDNVKQAIADSWPNKLDDSAAREEWGWEPEYSLDKMSEDMIKNLRIKLNEK